MEKHHDPISRQLTSWIRSSGPRDGLSSPWLQECYLEHRGGDTSVCTGIVDRKCDPVAICQLAIDNVKGLDGTTRTGSWSPRGQGATGAQNLQNHPQAVIVHERQPAWALSRPQMWRWFGWVWRLGAMMCNVCWIVQGLPGFTEWRFKMTPRFVSGDGVPWLLPFGIHLAILGRTWKKKSKVASPVF